MKNSTGFPIGNVFILLLVSIFLAGCGGGGSSGSVIALSDPSSPLATTPPSSTADYAESAPDTYFMDGGEIGDDISDTVTASYSRGVTMLHHRIAGPRPNNPILNVWLPPRDVRRALRDGWTGRGVNILIMDDFGVEGKSSRKDEGEHGYNVTMSALEIAPRASYFGHNVGFVDSGISYGEGGLRAKDNTLIMQSTEFGVVNQSFGVKPESHAPLQNDIDREYTSDTFRELIDSTASFITAGDAVITKAAGNEGVDSGYAVGNVALVSHAQTKDRALIVGGLNRYAQGGGASLFEFSGDDDDDDFASNFAGSNEEIQKRFLVEYGGSPYREDAYLCPKDAIGCAGSEREFIGSVRAFGTSFAAPRVGGLAALVRGKFPNLTGAATASILLDTATSEGLICHPSCPESTYGQGRVDIGRALAPVAPVGGMR